MRPLAFAGANVLVLCAHIACSEDGAGSQAEDAAVAGVGGTVGSAETNGTGGLGGCLAIGCPLGYQPIDTCGSCEPIPNWCGEGYEQCAELAGSCEAGTVEHAIKSECCACVVIDGGTDGSPDAQDATADNPA
jgi:hypothetical protein